jgi:hypothetical protein
VKFADKNFFQKSAIKRDGPVFFSRAPIKVAGDENTIIVFVVSRWGEAQSSETLREGGKPKKPSKSHQIKVNHTKSNLFFYSNS